MKFLSILPVLAVVLIAGCIGQTAEEARPYKIGLDFPMSGALAVYGTNFAPPAQLAVEEINAAGGVNGRMLALIIEDNQGDPKQAATAATKLISVDNVDLIASVTTPLSGAIAPITEANKKVFVYASSVSSFARNNNYVFKDYGDVVEMCTKLTEEAVGLNKSKIAVFGVNSEFTTDCRSAAEGVPGAELAAFENFNPGETDYRTQLAKIKEAGPDALILSAFAQQCIGIWKQIAEAGISTRFLLPFTKVACGEEAALAAANATAAGSIGVDFLVDPENPTPELADFLQKFKARFGNDPKFAIESAMFYDRIYFFKEALERCPDAGSDCLVEAFEDTRMVGASGDIYFTPEHLSVRPIRLIILSDGKWVDYP